MIKQLAHACIHSADLEKTRWFYCDVLGCKPGFNFIRDGNVFGFYVQLGGNTFLEVFQGQPGGDGGIKHLAIEVRDIDALMNHLKSHALPVGEKKLGKDGSWQFWSEDPNGVKLEFQQYTPQSSQLTGADCVMS